MAYIYLITNTVNGKQYIGKTERCVETRFLEHKRDSTRRSHEVRPLYRAMNKYGVDKFECACLLTTLTPEDDEIRLIEEYDTYNNGYNATLGGDGSRYVSIDLEELKIKYLKDVSNSVKKLAEEYGHDVHTISNLLKESGVEVVHGARSTGKSVQQIDKVTGEVLAIFKSTAEAARVLGMTNGSHITKCAKGKRSTAGGFCWEYLS